MEATLNEFCENNFENASLNRIIKNAKISKGTFYYHFENKEALYIHLLKKSVDAKWQFINNYTQEQQADFSEMDIFDKFLYQAKAGAVFANSNPKYNKLSIMFVKEKGNEIYDKAIEQLNGTTDDILKGMITEAYKNSELNTAFSEDFITQVLSYLFKYYDDIFYDNITDLDASINNLENFVEFMKHGLKGRK